MEIEKKHIAILIMAAGASSRMKQPKQLLEWGETTLLSHCINKSLSLNTGAVVVVLGAYEDIIAPTIESMEVITLVNPYWQQGLGSSIAFGVKYLRDANQFFDAALICLADQPLIDLEHLNTLINSYLKEDNKIVATAYEKQHGVPAIFGNRFFDGLAELKDDKGAQEFISAHKNDVLAIDAGDKTKDIDTMEAYRDVMNERRALPEDK